LGGNAGSTHFDRNAIYRDEGKKKKKNRNLRQPIQKKKKKRKEIEILGNTITLLHFAFFVRELLTRE
jgi:hypothetical protein